MIKNGVDVNQETRKGSNPLLDAIDRKWEKVCLAHIENGADVNLKLEKREALLVEACRAGLETVPQ